MRRSARIFLYSLYALIAVLFFLYFRFPSDAVRDLLIEQVSQVQPDVKVSTRQVNPVFPPGLKFKPLEVQYAALPLASADFLKLRPELLSLLREQKNFIFGGSIGSGEFNGRAELAAGSRGVQARVLMNMTGVPIEALALFRNWPGYKPSGDVNADIDYDSRQGTGGAARVNLNISPAKVMINPPIMGLGQIEFATVQAEMTITPQMLQIRRCEASGPQLEGRVSGSVIFRQPLETSRVTLSCTLKPQAAFVAEHKNDVLGGLLANNNAQKRGIVFRISGTLDDPRYVIR